MSYLEYRETYWCVRIVLVRVDVLDEYKDSVILEKQDFPGHAEGFNTEEAAYAFFNKKLFGPKPEKDCNE